MMNREAVDLTIQALHSEGRISDHDAAVVQMVESLASSVDAEPGNASLWREFRAALETLRKLGEEDSNDSDEISVIIAALRGDAKVFDAEDAKPAKSRSRVGKVGGSAR